MEINKDTLKSPIFVVGFAIFMSLLSISLTKEAAPKPILFQLITDFADGRKLLDYNLGYLVYSGIFYKYFGNFGLIIGQVINYVLIGVISFFIVETILGRNNYFSTIAACLTLIYPNVWLNVHRIVETNLAILLILIFIYLLLPKVMKRKYYLKSILLGLVCGFMIITRSNLVVVTLLTLPSFLKSFGKFSLTVLSALIILVFIPKLTTGNYYPKPQAGGYSFFSGANPFTKATLLKYLNTEPISPKLSKDLNIDYSLLGSYWNNISVFNQENIERKLVKYSLTWVKDHPLDYIELMFVKFWTVMRPDTRGASRQSGLTSFVSILIQSTMALIFPTWLLVKIAFKNRFYNPIGVTPFMVLYFIPFLLTTAEPRYRQPLDILCLLEITILFALYFKDKKMMLKKEF